MGRLGLVDLEILVILIDETKKLLYYTSLARGGFVV